MRRNLLHVADSGPAMSGLGLSAVRWSRCFLSQWMGGTRRVLPGGGACCAVQVQCSGAKKSVRQAVELLRCVCLFFWAGWLRFPINGFTLSNLLYLFWLYRRSPCTVLYSFETFVCHSFEHELKSVCCHLARWVRSSLVKRDGSAAAAADPGEWAARVGASRKRDKRYQV